MEKNIKSNFGERRDWKFLIHEIPENTLLLDCRSIHQFQEKTIKGAMSAHLIKKPHGSSKKSLFKLSSFLKTIIDLSQKYEYIVAFDEGLGMFSGKLVFLLKSLDIPNVFILNRLFSEIPEKELEAGKEILTESEIKKPYQISSIVPISYVQTNLVKVQLIDVRTREEYDGKLPRLLNPEPGSLCGKIPGSIHFDWLELYNKNGYLLSKQQILKKLRMANLILERPTILYDFNGARSCFVALILKECKYRDVKVFLGSWMEWRKTQLPKQNVHKWYP